MTVGLHQKQRLAIQGKPNLRVILNAMNCQTVQELERAGDDLRGDDRGDGFGGLVHLRERGDHGLFRRRLRNEPEQDLGDHAQRSFRADEQILKRVSGDVLDALVAGPQQFTGRQHDLHSHDVVAGDAVFQPAQTARVFGDVAADG